MYFAFSSTNPHWLHVYTSFLCLTDSFLHPFLWFKDKSIPSIHLVLPSYPSFLSGRIALFFNLQRSLLSVHLWKCSALSFTSLSLFGHRWHLAETCLPLSIMTSTDCSSVHTLWVGSNHEAVCSNVWLIWQNRPKIKWDWPACISLSVERKKHTDGSKSNWPRF